MKHSVLFFSVALLGLAACQPDNTDGANDAAGTASPYLAREVVGVHMLSNDSDYDQVSSLLAEEFVRGTFDLGGTTEIDITDTRNGGVFSWDRNRVEVSFQTPKPYPSIYHSEYAFNNLYQSGAGNIAPQPQKAPITGPNTEGIGAELPAESATGSAAQRDTSASNDTSSNLAGIEASATRLVTPAVTTNRFVAYPGLGDKAVWDASTKSMHVLLNNHILNIRINTADAVTVAKSRAAILANVVLNQVVKND